MHSIMACQNKANAGSFKVSLSRHRFEVPFKMDNVQQQLSTIHLLNNNTQFSTLGENYLHF